MEMRYQTHKVLLSLLPYSQRNCHCCDAICNTTCTDSKATTKLVVVHTSYYLYIVLVLQLLVLRVMLVPKVDAKSGEAAALVVFQVALVVLCLPALYCSNPNVRP